MENVWFTSDCHFYHKKIMEFCPNTRAGADAEEMSELMIESWNKRVKPTDRVYHLGDFSFTTVQKTKELLGRLNGSKHFLAGNHDRQLDGLRHLLESYRDYKVLYLQGYKIVMMHYPIESWDGMHRDTLHFHGHIHGDMHHSCRLIKNRVDVGIDTRQDKLMAPYHFDEILERINIQNSAIQMLNQ